MRPLAGCAAVFIACAMLGSPAAADEDEILSHYDAYESAMQRLDYVAADREAEAAWRAAEETWGDVEETGVLAFNVVRLRLMNDQRAQAVEPARRIAELVAEGNLQSVTPAEAALFTQLANFDASGADRQEVGELVAALEAVPATEFASTRISWLGWAYAADRYKSLDRWEDALSAAQHALAALDNDPTAAPVVVGTIAITAADAAYNADEVEKGLAATHQAVAAFPAQPADQELDSTLAALLVWQQGLTQLYGQQTQSFYTPSDPALMNPAWDDERSPMARGCAPLQWVEQPAPQFGGFGRRGGPGGVGSVFEYYIEADGSVGAIDYYGAGSVDDQPFTETLRSWKAAVPERTECRGPWMQVTAYLPQLSNRLGGRVGISN